MDRHDEGVGLIDECECVHAYEYVRMMGGWVDGWNEETRREEIIVCERRLSPATTRLGRRRSQRTSAAAAVRAEDAGTTRTRGAAAGWAAARTASTEAGRQLIALLLCRCRRGPSGCSQGATAAVRRSCASSPSEQGCPVSRLTEPWACYRTAASKGAESASGTPSATATRSGLRAATSMPRATRGSAARMGASAACTHCGTPAEEGDAVLHRTALDTALP